MVGERGVTLSIAPDAVVDTSLAAALASPDRRVLQARTGSQPVTAYTAKAEVTAAALRGTPGELVAARISRPGGTTVATGPAAAEDSALPAPAETEGLRPGI